MAFGATHSSISLSPSYLPYFAFAKYTVSRVPRMIRKIPGRSYLHMKRSPKSQLDITMLARIATGLVADSRTRSAYGRHSRWIKLPALSISVPSHHVALQQ